MIVKRHEGSLEALIPTVPPPEEGEVAVPLDDGLELGTERLHRVQLHPGLQLQPEPVLSLRLRPDTGAGLLLSPGLSLM